MSFLPRRLPVSGLIEHGKFFLTRAGRLALNSTSHMDYLSHDFQFKFVTDPNAAFVSDRLRQRDLEFARDLRHKLILGISRKWSRGNP